MKTKNYSPDSGTIARTIILMLALANQVLTTFGYSAIPIHDSEIQNLISLTLTLIMSLITWWKNNSFTKTAKVGDEAIKKAKTRKFNQNK